MYIHKPSACQSVSGVLDKKVEEVGEEERKEKYNLFVFLKSSCTWYQ
jgi:hypothetical protein